MVYWYQSIVEHFMDRELVRLRYLMSVRHVLT
jgi:hypothetical protein